MYVCKFHGMHGGHIAFLYALKAGVLGTSKAVGDFRLGTDCSAAECYVRTASNIRLTCMLHSTCL